MRFDADRLSVLAGLSPKGGSSVISEGSNVHEEDMYEEDAASSAEAVAAQAAKLKPLIPPVIKAFDALTDDIKKKLGEFGSNDGGVSKRIELATQLGADEYAKVLQAWFDVQQEITNDENGNQLPDADLEALQDEFEGEPQVKEDDLFELGNLRKRDEQGDTDEGGHQLAEAYENEIVEIDENMLRKEIMRMRQERQSVVAESKMRTVIRHEIDSILSEMSDDLYTDNSWVYGNNKPKRSRKGQVTLGALGIGFE